MGAGYSVRAPRDARFIPAHCYRDVSTTTDWSSYFMRYDVSVVAEFVIPIVVALPVFLLWFAVVTLLGRAFGVRLSFPSFRRHNGTSQSLTFSQHMWFIGVLYWGCGMWIVTTLGDYLDWKYWSGSLHDLSSEKLLFNAVLWPLAGLLFGWTTWNTRSGKANS